MKKALVVYFSHAGENYNVGEVTVGNTELLAKEIASQCGADEFKIVPKVAYPKGYSEAVEVATEELNDEARPEYEGEVDITPYDTIFLGYPIWWGDLPMVVYTFLEAHDFAGKTVIPFNTHEGSGNAGTYSRIEELLPEAKVAGGGFNMSGKIARTEEGKALLGKWLESLAQ